MHTQGVQRAASAPRTLRGTHGCLLLCVCARTHTLLPAGDRAAPRQLWELYRFRAGQAPGPAVTFAGNCRLLGEHVPSALVSSRAGGAEAP
jgi:hypothetical protein